ncbi:MAG TPA: DotU family type IV/VI secretion system protein [Gemmatimonadales bacterium]|nr:DotU family type IV/VI secretion system protein [Gemmatimonadales bacterium]
MTGEPTRPPRDASEPQLQRRGSLSLVLQEALTAIERLRANRQVAADGESFRAHLKHLLGAAEEEARRSGYANGDIKRAIYAVTVFADESVLNSSQPMFADWPKKPLQEELFGGHMGGELFFKNLQELLTRQDAEDLADLLEVHQLCLLLGFKGRYSMSDGGELRGLIHALGQKIDRIRGGVPPLSPAWSLPANEQIPVAFDPWLRRLGYGALGVLTFAMMLLLIFALVLKSGAADIAILAAKAAP